MGVAAVEGLVKPAPGIVVGLAATVAGPAVDEAFRSVTSETIAKFLFTSGTTGAPKAVVNTHGMLASSWQMLRQCWPFVVAEPPILVDWLPWHGRRLESSPAEGETLKKSCVKVESFDSGTVA